LTSDLARKSIGAQERPIRVAAFVHCEVMNDDTIRAVSLTRLGHRRYEAINARDGRIEFSTDREQCYLDEPTSEVTNDLCIRWNAPPVYVATYLAGGVTSGHRGRSPV
jgi:hypothetical protein